MLKNSSFIIAKQKLSELFGTFTPRSEWCVNKNCADETEDIVEYVWNYGNSRYIHHTQFALNKTTIIVNGKPYDVNTPYCCECFKNHVLVEPIFKNGLIKIKILKVCITWLKFFYNQ